MNKKCTHCEKLLDTSHFYIDNDKPSWFKPRCKDCERILYRVKRAKNNETFTAKDTRYYQNHKEEIAQKRKNKYSPEKAKAHWMVNTALKKWILTKWICQICGSDNAQWHHEDYSKPLDIIWLCRPHHMQLHHGK